MPVGGHRAAQIDLDHLFHVARVQVVKEIAPQLFIRQIIEQPLLELLGIGNGIPRGGIIA